MESESFYGVTLSEKEPIAQFDVQEFPDEQLIHSYKLIIQQILLGVEAKQGEFNVIEAEIKTQGKNFLKIPIAVLKAGETRLLKPNLEFPNGSVTFKLIRGTGPVHMCGKAEVNLGVLEDAHMYEEYSDDEDNSDVESDDDVPPPQTNGNTNKKK